MNTKAVIEELKTTKENKKLILGGANHYPELFEYAEQHNLGIEYWLRDILEIKDDKRKAQKKQLEEAHKEEIKRIEKESFEDRKSVV